MSLLINDSYVGIAITYRVLSLLLLDGFEFFTIQEINLTKKDLSYNIELKEIEAYWNNECGEHPSKNHYKMFYD